jgi:hypothetical protein
MAIRSEDRPGRSTTSTLPETNQEVLQEEEGGRAGSQSGFLDRGGRYLDVKKDCKTRSRNSWTATRRISSISGASLGQKKLSKEFPGLLGEETRISSIRYVDLNLPNHLREKRTQR